MLLVSENVSSSDCPGNMAKNETISSKKNLLYLRITAILD